MWSPRGTTMVELSEPNTEAPKNEDRGLIHETKMLADWPRLPPLQGTTKRLIRDRARAPEGQDALQTLKHRYVVVRHLARVKKGPRKSRDFGVDSAAGKAVFFWWRTGIPLKSSGFLKIFWKVQPDGSLSEGTSIVERHPGNITRVYGRRLPSEAKFVLSGHGLYRNNVRGHITAMGSAAYGANLVNAVKGLKSRGDMAPYAYFVNKSGAVTGQWLITTPEGTVAVLKAGGDGSVYLATTLEPEMAAAQAWVCNPPKPPHRSNNDRTSSQGGIA